MNYNENLMIFIKKINQSYRKTVMENIQLQNHSNEFE